MFTNNNVFFSYLELNVKIIDGTKNSALYKVVYLDSLLLKNMLNKNHTIITRR